jgi:hypothetical protein
MRRPYQAKGAPAMALQPELEKDAPNRQLALVAGGIALASMAWQD